MSKSSFSSPDPKFSKFLNFKFFAKKEQENLSKSELLAFKTLSKDILNQSNDDLDIAIEQGVFIPLGGEK